MDSLHTKHYYSKVIEEEVKAKRAKVDEVLKLPKGFDGSSAAEGSSEAG